jgi:hypothetical protein
MLTKTFQEDENAEGGSGGSLQKIPATSLAEDLQG